MTVTTMKEIELLWSEGCASNCCTRPVAAIYVWHPDPNVIGRPQKILRLCDTHRPAGRPAASNLQLVDAEYITLLREESQMPGLSLAMEEAKESGYLILSNCRNEHNVRKLYEGYCDDNRRPTVFIKMSSHDCHIEFKRTSPTVPYEKQRAALAHASMLREPLREKMAPYGSWGQHAGATQAWMFSNKLPLVEAEPLARQIFDIELVVMDPDLLLCSQIMDT
jgi:hypothetical protein